MSIPNASLASEESSTDSSGEVDARSIYASQLHLVSTLTQPTADEIKTRTISLGAIGRRHTLILDIDGTLLHASLLPNLSDKAEDDVKVCVRPYARELIEALSPLYEIVLFTAGTEEYADKIKKCLDPVGTHIVRALGKSSCILTREGYYVKDLRIFSDRELKNIVIVDDNITSFAFQLSNGVPVVPYEGEESDEELRFLIDYLRDLDLAEDVRSANEEKLHLV